MAEEEVRLEDLRQQIEAYKSRLRWRRKFWVRIFPWRLRIERRDIEPPRTPKEIEAHHLKALEAFGWTKGTTYDGQLYIIAARKT